MKLINIGFGNLVSADHLMAIISPDSAPIKRIVQEAKERGMLVDASYGRKTQTVILMDTDHVILSAIPTENLYARWMEKPEPEEEEPEEQQAVEDTAYFQQRQRIQEMLSTEGPFLLQCAVKAEDDVLPMIPPGSNIDEMLLEVK